MNKIYLPLEIWEKIHQHRSLSFHLFGIYQKCSKPGCFVDLCGIFFFELDANNLEYKVKFLFSSNNPYYKRCIKILILSKLIKNVQNDSIISNFLSDNIQIRWEGDDYNIMVCNKRGIIRKIYFPKSKFLDYCFHIQEDKHFQKIKRYNLSYKNTCQRFSTIKLISKMKSLTQLDLGYTNLTKFPVEFCQFRYLKKLSLFDNRIKTFPKEINQLSSIRKISCVLNDLTKLPESFGELITLQYLRFHEYRLNNIPESLQNLHNLKRLIIECTKSDAILHIVGHFKLLRTLTIDECQLKKLPESIDNLHHLKYLTTVGGVLENIPASLLKNSRHIHCKFIKLQNTFTQFHTVSLLELCLQFVNKSVILGNYDSDSLYLDRLFN